MGRQAWDEPEPSCVTVAVILASAVVGWVLASVIEPHARSVAFFVLQNAMLMPNPKPVLDSDVLLWLAIPVVAVGGWIAASWASSFVAPRVPPRWFAVAQLLPLGFGLVLPLAIALVGPALVPDLLIPTAVVLILVTIVQVAWMIVSDRRTGRG